ncbi:MAG: hypothetical protein LC739_01815 [Actinobacteria bacterium]|nr:hypothetical protein [Actinomycetota bacterium]
MAYDPGMTYAAGGAAALIAVVALFQIMLALGVPWGAAAWGGRNAGVLPTKLRIASAASALLLGGIAWLVLARSASANPPTWLMRLFGSSPVTSHSDRS